MKALSIQQPWAWLIVNGHKNVENRDWATKFRGPVLIHAGKTFDWQGYAWIRDKFPAIRLGESRDFERGGIVGMATITDCVEAMDDSPWFFGDYGFVMQNARPLPFAPLKGQLQFFDVPGYTPPAISAPNPIEATGGNKHMAAATKAPTQAVREDSIVAEYKRKLAHLEKGEKDFSIWDTMNDNTVFNRKLDGMVKESKEKWARAQVDEDLKAAQIIEIRNRCNCLIEVVDELREDISAMRTELKSERMKAARYFIDYEMILQAAGFTINTKDRKLVEDPPVAAKAEPVEKKDGNGKDKAAPVEPIAVGKSAKAEAKPAPQAAA